METFLIVLAVVACIILLIGSIRIILSPWRGFDTFLAELFLLDFMADMISAIVNFIGDAID